MRGTNRHRIRYRTVVLALLGSLLLGCATNSSASLDSTIPTGGDAEQRIASLVHDWFAVLEEERAEPRSLDRFMAEPSFELMLIGGRVKSLAELDAWLAHLHSTHYDLAYEIGSVDVESVAHDLHRVGFEFERRAVDGLGARHVARREHAWLVRVVAGRAPVIVRIDEQPLLAFSGTGPQIVCY